jgi:hypothetical protein
VDLLRYSLAGWGLDPSGLVPDVDVNGVMSFMEPLADALNLSWINFTGVSFIYFNKVQY